MQQSGKQQKSTDTPLEDRDIGAAVWLGDTVLAFNARTKLSSMAFASWSLFSQRNISTYGKSSKPNKYCDFFLLG